MLELGAQAPCATCTRPGAITVGRAGEQLAPMAEMAALGVRIFTDDGTGVQDDRLMRRAMEYATGLGRHAGPALRGRRALPAAGTCTRASGRAGSASPANPPRPRS